MNKVNKNPLVSIIMPVYNGEEFIAEALQSALTQTYKNLEVIVVDDCSTDGTYKVISTFKKKYPKKLKVVKLRKNRGQGGDAAANVAFQYTKGDFIARLDADDIALPDRVEKQVKFMLKNMQYSVVGTSAHVINPEGEVVGEKKMPTTHKAIYRNCFVYHPMINPTQMFRRDHLIDKKNLYLLDNPTNNDYLTTMKKISNGAKYYNLPEKLIYYRIHDRNDSLARVRRTFRNSLTTRIRAVREFGYRPSKRAIVKFLAQIALVYVLPEKLVFQIYLLVRGITKPRFELVMPSFSIFARLKKVIGSS